MALVSASQFNLTPDILGAVSKGLNAFNAVKAGQAREQQLGFQQQQLGIQQQQLGNQQRAAGQKFAAGEQAAGQLDLQTRATETFNAASQINNLPTDEAKVNALRARKAKLLADNKDTTDTDAVLSLYESGDAAGGSAMLQSAVQTGIQQGFLKAPNASLTSGQKEFKDLTEGLTEDQKSEAKLVKLGLSPRAVGSAIQTISSEGIADLIGDTEATISQRKKFGEMTGSSRAKTIDRGVETIAKIDVGLRNVDKAIELLNKGAGVGAIEKLLPSFKASSVALDNVQKRMALDVIGAVTFGALSKGELDLSKEVALPTGLDTPDLIVYLQERKAAQEKLRSYYNEQIQFLDQGGTVAGFIRSKERSQTAQPDQQPPELLQKPSGKQGGVLHTDAQGNQAFVFPDGSFEEVQ